MERELIGSAYWAWWKSLVWLRFTEDFTQIQKHVLMKLKIKLGYLKDSNAAAHSVDLSNRPQVSMVYRLINHVGCWQKTRRICKSWAAGKWFTNPSSVLPTFQVFRNSENSEDARFFCGFTGTTTHSRLTNESSCIDLVVILNDIFYAVIHY